MKKYLIVLCLLLLLLSGCFSASVTEVTSPIISGTVTPWVTFTSSPIPILSPAVPTVPTATPPFVSPRAVQVTKPETVKIPRPPIASKPANSGKRELGPPPKPAEERQKTRDSKNQDANKNKEKDKNK